MQVELTKEQHAAVKDSLGEFITENGGKFTFDGESSAEVATLKKTLKKERDRADAADKKLKDFGDLDVDKAKEALEAVESGKLKTDTEVQQAQREAVKKAVADTKAEAQKTIDALTGDINRHKLTEPIKAAALKAGVLPKLINQVAQLNEQRFKLDGDKVVVLDADGDPTATTVDDYFAKGYKTDYPEFYAPNGGGGSGSNGSNSNGNGATGKTMTRDAFFKMSPVEQTTFSKEHGVLTD